MRPDWARSERGVVDGINRLAHAPWHSAVRRHGCAEGPRACGVPKMGRDGAKMITRAL